MGLSEESREYFVERVLERKHILTEKFKGDKADGVKKMQQAWESIIEECVAHGSCSSSIPKIVGCKNVVQVSTTSNG